MAYKSILVHIGTDRRTAQRLRLACRLATTFDAGVAGLFVTPPLVLPAPYGNPAAILGAEALEAQRDAIAEHTASARAAFEKACAEAGVGGEWYDEGGEPGTVVSTYARYCDLVVLGQSESEGLAAVAPQLPERVVLASGRPVLIVPYAGDFATVGERVLVAWNASREAARAVADALPLLRRAGRVIVFEIDPSEEAGPTGAELARRLARHGVAAEAQHTVSGGITHGEILLSAISDQGADCVVMGAYGHSRVRELALGGVTRTVLAHMTVPVIMSY